MRPVAVIAELCISCTPFAGFLGFSMGESTDNAVTLAIIGVASVLLTGLMVPLVRWMMKRLDGHDRQSQALASRREAREDARQRAFASQVEALGKITTALESIGTAQTRILQVLNDLPAQIVNKCNGKP